MIGFETIGNATLIVHDGKPVLLTDPWLGEGAYFGSWTLPYEIPEAQLRAIDSAEFVWISHGHPDHLDPVAMERLHGKKILLPDHVGSRIRNELQGSGFSVSVLRDRTWVSVSDNVRVLCVSDYFQDGVLLVDVGGVLLVNLNDAADRGWGRFVKRIIRGYPRSFRLKLFGYGDVDMMNFFDEDGKRRELVFVRRRSIGQQIEFFSDLYGVTDVVPFSCFHRYQIGRSPWSRRTSPRSRHTSGGSRTSPTVSTSSAFESVGSSRRSRLAAAPGEGSRSKRPEHP